MSSTMRWRLASEFGDRETAARLVEQDHKLVRFHTPEKARWSKIATATTGLGAISVQDGASVVTEAPLSARDR
jgi:hypothetical protein